MAGVTGSSAQARMIRALSAGRPDTYPQVIRGSDPASRIAWQYGTRTGPAQHWASAILSCAASTHRKVRAAVRGRRRSREK